MRILIAVLACSLCAAASAQGLNKCRDAAGKVTYASQDCETLGLKPAGEIQDRSSVAPAYKAPPPPRVAKPAAKKDATAPDAAPAAERRCFKTAKGYRCNDSPDEKG